MIFTGWMPLSTKEMGVKSKQILPGNLAQLTPLEPTTVVIEGGVSQCRDRLEVDA